MPAAVLLKRRRVGMLEALLCVFSAATMVLSGSAATAQDVDRVGVQSIQTPAPALGNVVSAPTGTTVFTVSPSTGNVTRTSGAGYRVSAGSTRSLVTVFCGGPGYCDNTTATVTVTSIGSPTGRAALLTNFTVHPGTATILTPPAGTSTIVFTIAPIGRNQTKTFYVGADLPVLGDNSGQPTGPATASFQVTVSLKPLPFEGSGVGQATATVFRPINIALTSNLTFGTVTRPWAGDGSVTINSSNGARTITGMGAQLMGVPAPARAAFLVTGEGGQVISVSVPQTFTMTGPGSLTVTTNTTASGSLSLSSSLGSGGSYSFHVGGTLPTNGATPLGDYSGSFAVTVQYN